MRKTVKRLAATTITTIVRRLQIQGLFLFNVLYFGPLPSTMFYRIKNALLAHTRDHPTKEDIKIGLTEL